MEKIYKNVYDFSVHNGKIDWKKLRDAGVDFVMLRAGYGRNNIDERFHDNANACMEHDIPFGIYWFSYAYNTEMAEKEAEYALSAVKKYKLECPVAYDLEYDTVRYAKTKGINIDKRLATDMAEAFCSRIVRAGYTAVNYANKDYLKNMFEDTLLKYPLWYARYNAVAGQDNMVLWQYSSSGRVEGVAGNVDMNYMYQMLPSRNVKTTGEKGAELNRSGITVYSLKESGEKKLFLNAEETNFRVKEFRCKDGSDEVKIDGSLVEILQRIRTYFGRPVIINSAYRTPAYNEKVDGASQSYHLFGTAADIRIDGVAPITIAAYAEGIGVKGIGMYHSFVHVDTREKKYYWVNKSGNRVETFGGQAASGTKPADDAVLKFGNESTEVKWMQERLNRLGFSLKADGIFGEKTLAAVIEFQKKVGIKADGTAGAVTIGYLAA